MRCAVLGALTVLLLGACGERVADHLDAIRRSGRRFVHGEGLIRYEDTPAERSVAPRLREMAGGRALLEQGKSAVPALVELLDDPDRRTLAAVFLAEIGGSDAAAELLRRWRSLRDDAKEKRILLPVAGGQVALGYRYEGVDDDFYGELIMALGYAGLPVSAEIAKDTEVAIAESDRLAAAGEELVFREEREEDGRMIELRWSAEPAETASEGLKILALLRAPDAPSLFEKAIRSPVRRLRRTGVQEVLFLGDAADRMLPVLGPLLDDPDLRVEAVQQVAFLLDDGATTESVPVHHLSGEQQAALAIRCKERLKELGHLR